MSCVCYSTRRKPLFHSELAMSYSPLRIRFCTVVESRGSGLMVVMLVMLVGRGTALMLVWVSHRSVRLYS